MKALLATGLVAACAVAGGCASPQYTAEDLDGRIVCDEPHMIAVEREAQRRNTQVHWVHCPTGTLRVVRN